MKLNIAIPTYNRAASLDRTLTSIRNARIPRGLIVEVAVIDNNSSDNTREIVECQIPQFKGLKLEYVFEGRQGKSFAFNTAVERSDGDLFAGIDDDIEIAEDWIEGVYQLFSTRDEICFAGGKILPNWESPPPDWIGPLKDGVIGWRDYGDEEWEYDYRTPILTGGHAVFRRSVFETVGLLPEKIGPTGKNLIGCEDDVFFDKLLSSGLKGIYCPEMVFYHFVPTYRLSKSYYRQWCFGAGISKHLLDVHYKRIEGARFLDVPRWMYRQFLTGILEKLGNLAKGNTVGSLANDNPILVFAGFVYAKHIRESRLNRPLSSVFVKLVRPANR